MDLAVRVPLDSAETVRRDLIEKGVVDFSRKPAKEQDHFLIPVIRRVTGYDIVERSLPTKKEQLDLKTALKDELTQEELSKLKTSYDLLGEIAIMEIDEELRHKEDVIARTLLGLFSNIKTVVRKEGPHKGELRLQDYKHLAGEETFETTVIENGVRLELDIRKTYYSVRSATERKRVAGLVKDGERVLVMFSGIAPFVLVIAKHSAASEVIGVELNEQAHEYAERNIKKNHLDNARVKQGDVRAVVPELKEFDRVIMPLPHTAEDFLDVAVPATKEMGMIHLYHFSTQEEVEELAKTIPSRLESLGRSGRVEHIERCGNLAPGIHRWTLDIRVD